MRYTQKDMRELLGFSRDTLRLYERRGIIHPQIDPHNGYRYYDDWQVNLLWDCRYYQGMGFSLAQIEQILQHDSLEGLETRLDTRCDQLKQDLRYQRLVLDECERNLSLMREVSKLMGTYQLQTTEECVFVPKRREHELCSEPNSPAVAFSNRHAGLMAPYFLFPEAGVDTYYWGFAMRASVYKKLGENVDDSAIMLLKSRKALMTCIDAGERWSFGQHLFEDLCAEAQRRGLQPTSGPRGVLVARTHDTDGYHRYVRAYLPIS